MSLGDLSWQSLFSLINISPVIIKCEKYWQEILIVSAIILTYLLTLSGPGRDSEARMTKLTAANQKPLTLWHPNFVTFSFYL